MASVATQIKAINLAVDEMNDELGELRADLHQSGASIQEDRRSQKILVYLYGKRLKALEDRIAALESRLPNG